MSFPNESRLTLTVTASSGAGVLPGTISIGDGTAVVASGKADPSNKFSFSTTLLKSGTHSLWASYAGDEVNLASQSSTVNLLVDVPPDFAVSSSTSNATLRAGQSAQFTITIAPAGQFAAGVTFACAGLPPLASCEFNPATVTPAVKTSVTTTLTVRTTGPAAHLQPAAHSPVYALWIQLALAGLCGIVATCRRTRRSSAVLLILLALLAACGGGTSSSPRTPTGASTVTVTATSGSLTHTIPLSITVQ